MDTLVRAQPIDVVHHKGLRIGNANIYMPVHTAEIRVLRTQRLLDILKVGVISPRLLLHLTVLSQAN